MGYTGAMSAAWRQLGLGSYNAPGEVFPKFTKTDFDKLKADYNDTYGYTIRIPQWDDIIHTTPDFLKDEAVLKAERKENLIRVLESPVAGWANQFSSAMTWIDDIQDTMSVVYPLLSILARVSPKVFGKMVPVIGWIGTAYDLLNIANGIGRIPFQGFGGKRAACKFWKRNPFSKNSRLQNAGNIRNYNSGFGDVLQALQVLDSFTGMGVSFGGLMGAITALPFGVYHYLAGDPVKFSFEAPEIDNLRMMGSRGMKAAAAIASQGQTFSEEMHFWSHMTGFCSSMLLSGVFHEERLAEMVINPRDVALPAPEPTNPITRRVIEEAGLNIEKGVGWPYNGKKEISVADYLDATAESARSNFYDYCRRHSNDQYGMLTAAAVESQIIQSISAMEPDSNMEFDDTDEMKVFFTMVKAPLIPQKPYTEEQANAFFDWVREYSSRYGKRPGLLEIEQKLESLGIKTKKSYPDKPTQDAMELWPIGYTGNDEI